MGVQEDASDFSLGGRCHNIFDDFGQDVDRAVEGGSGEVAEIKITAGAASCLWVDKVCGVRVEAEDHVTGAVENLSVRVACSVVEKVFHGFHRGSGTVVHGGRNVTECMEHSMVDGACVEKKFSNDAFNVLDIRGRERCGRVIVNKLRRGAKAARREGGRGVLVALGSDMLEFLESLGDVAIHGAAEFAAVVIPTEVDADVLFSIAVNLESVLLVHNGFQVVEILILRVLDTKIVDDKGEGDFAGLVEEKAVSEGRFHISVFAEMLDEVVVGDLACLFESIPRLFNFRINETIDDKVVEVIIRNNSRRDECKTKTNILGVREVRH